MYLGSVKPVIDSMSEAHTVVNMTLQSGDMCCDITMITLQLSSDHAASVIGVDV